MSFTPVILTEVEKVYLERLSVNDPGQNTVYGPFGNKSSLVSCDLKYTPCRIANYNTQSGDITNISYNNMYWYFKDSINLESVYNINDNVVNMYGTFYGCTKLTYISNFPSHLENLDGTFRDCISLKNLPNIPSSVNNINNAFNGCKSLVNPPTFNGDNIYANSAFRNCTSLVSTPNISKFITTLSNTFYGCTSLSNIVGSIDNSVTNLNYTFYDCKLLVTPPTIPENVTDMDQTFRNCISLATPPQINGVDGRINGRGAFINCTSLTTTPNLSKFKILHSAFSGCTSLTNIIGDLSGIESEYDGLNHSQIDSAFQYCPITSLSCVIPSQIKSIAYTFYNCTNLNVFPTIQSTDIKMAGAFEGCSSLTTANVNGANNLAWTFASCSSLTTVSGTINSNCTDMSYTFVWCSVLRNVPQIPVNVTDLRGTFQGCSLLTGNIIINSSSVTNVSGIFSGTSATKYVYIPYNSTTYNTFIAAGYDEYGTKEGVYLRNISNL